jgi:hypothetical protein
MNDPLVAAIGITAVVVVMGWFALGTGWNIRRGNAILRWLQDGLTLLGTRTTLRWLGSSAVELGIVDPAQPFRDLTVLVVLEPRDVPWLWLLSRSRGRRDLLIVRGSFRRAPMDELEVVAEGSWSASLPVQPGADRLEVVDDAPSSGARTRTVARAAGITADSVWRIWEELDAASAGAQHLSIRQTVPHFEAHALIGNVSRGPSSERLVRAVVGIAGEFAGSD